MNLIRRFGVPFAAALLAALVAISVAPIHSTIGAGRGGIQHDLKPLVDTHEFMEHIVEGTFDMLKKGLSAKPADAKAWRSVRDMSLILGESGNLLLIRKPDDADAADWSKLAISLRESGDALSKAAKAKDYDATRKAYLVLVQSCNACHIKYGDDGEPKIMP
jgi:cytochrome c556